MWLKNICFIKALTPNPRGVAWWQRAWDLHSRSRVRVRACTSRKSLWQPEFYSLIWTHKVHFLEDGVFSNPKKSSRDIAWWQRAWDLHSRSRVRIRTCTYYKNLRQPEFYLFIWAHKIHFFENKFPWVQKAIHTKSLNTCLPFFFIFSSKATCRQATFTLPYILFMLFSFY